MRDGEREKQDKENQKRRNFSKSRKECMKNLGQVLYIGRQRRITKRVEVTKREKTGLKRGLTIQNPKSKLQMHISERKFRT